jgi:predicted RNase H-like nuclease
MGVTERLSAGVDGTPVDGPWAGVDGCRAGWVVGRLEASGAATLELHRSVESVLASGPARLLIDMPIGLFCTGRVRPRACDREARARLGARRASVFAPPVRDMLDVGEHAPLGARGLSIQAFHLRTRIREIDRLIDPKLQERVAEGHPELAFARLNGAPLSVAKRSREGRRARREVLRTVIGEVDRVVDSMLAATLRRDLAEDDMLDALVLAVAARDTTRGSAWRLPAEPERDARGLWMEVYG